MRLAVSGLSALPNVEAREWHDAALSMKPSGAGVFRAQKDVGSHKSAPVPPRDVDFCGRGHETPSHHHALRFALVHSNHRNTLGHRNVETYRELPPRMSHGKLVFRVRPVRNHQSLAHRVRAYD